MMPSLLSRLTLRSWICQTIPCLASLLCASWASAAIDFNRDIRPILSENCFHCHGPDKSHREANLRLDDRDTAVKMTAIVPGEAGASGVITRVFSSDPDEQMPPAGSRKHLTDVQKELLRRWIEEGAVYKKHWSYEPPSKLDPSSAELNGYRVQNKIDVFIAKRLQQEGLSMSPRADRRTLARRLYFDLIGLPPTPQQIEAFVSDPTAGAYEHLVEQLLDSPHYGERMAMGWLDIVRFADTIGYHSDNPHEVWPYRDYVIKSFNENKRFDQFTIENLAGDLLPSSTQEQKVASCFNRLLLTTQEGGAQPKDYEARMLTDRVRAIGTVWLGQTLGCCQCHDHKYDPIATQDFYAMGAFFADIDEPIVGGREPGLVVPSDEQQAELKRLRKVAAELRHQYDAMPDQLVAAERQWESNLREAADEEDRWQMLKPTKTSTSNGLKLSAEKDGTLRAKFTRPRDYATHVVEAVASLSGITGIRLDVLPADDLRGPGLGPGGSFVLTEFELADADGNVLPITRAVATSESAGNSASFAIDGITDGQNGWSIEMAGSAQTICFELAKPLGVTAKTSLSIRLHQNQGEGRILGRFRLFVTNNTASVRAPQSVLPPKEILSLLRIDREKRTKDEQANLDAHFKSQFAELNDLRAKLGTAEKAAADFEANLPRCMVSKARAEPRIVRILPRGNWMDETGPIVQPAVPHYLPQPKLADPQRRLTRLDLANWLISRENPLVARVYVNRLWKQFFGIGLSKTLDDLGSQGEWPVHPELLDWLACEFVDSGWDIKHLVRLMVLSEAYRQDSTASVDLLARDPDNRLLARQSRFRLDAEFVRDNALAVSGLLSSTIGGPSVKPYQPDGYWDNLNFPVRSYDTDHGPNQYRRGLYTWWQRSFLHPSLLAFDAPTREECAADRSRSNIPQQALVLLNDPTYVETARALAERTLAEATGDTKSRLGWVWQQVLGRSPREDELTAATNVLEKHRAEYQSNVAAANALLKVGESPLPKNTNVGELAAWTNVARIVLNLHETITRN